MMKRKGMSVTRFIKTINQPEGGYLPIDKFEIKQFRDNKKLNPVENIDPSITGLVVDYMTRYLLNPNGEGRKNPFFISYMGAIKHKEQDIADKLIAKIKGLDAESIIALCELVLYDSIYRGNVKDFHNLKHVVPDSDTIENIIILVERTFKFFKKNKKLESHITFMGGYTDVISSGDADFIDHATFTLYDLKVSKYEPTISDTLQVLIYWTLHTQSCEDIGLEKVSIFNPRFNKSYTCDITTIDSEVLDNVWRLTQFGSPVCTEGYEIDDEIPLIIISRKEGNRFIDLDKKEILEMLDNFKLNKINPNSLFYNFARIKIDAKSETSVSGVAVKTLHQYMHGETARYIGDSIWSICNSKALEYNFLNDTFAEKGITKADIFNNFKKMINRKVASGI